ncbi:uncharacterized protein LOC120818523 isoform X2 [Gasterosteus aculeatus]
MSHLFSKVRHETRPSSGSSSRYAPACSATVATEETAGWMGLVERVLEGPRVRKQHKWHSLIPVWIIHTVFSEHRFEGLVPPLECSLAFRMIRTRDLHRNRVQRRPRDDLVRFSC